MGIQKKTFQGKPIGKMWKFLFFVCLWTIVCHGVPQLNMEAAKTFNIFSGDSTTENHEETTTIATGETTTEDSDLSYFAEWPLFCTFLWYPYDSEKCKSARCKPCAESIRATAQLCMQSEGSVSQRCLSRNVGVGFCNHCLGDYQEVKAVKTFFSEESKTESPEETTTMGPEETTTMGSEETTTMVPEDDDDEDDEDEDDDDKEDDDEDDDEDEDSNLSIFAEWPLFCTFLWYPYDSEKCKSARCMPCAESIQATAQLCMQSEGSVSPRCLSRNVGAGVCAADCLYKYV